MVDAITGFVVGKIGNYLIEEASMFMGVKDDLEYLKTELTCIQGYLKDVEAREREDEVSKEWTKLVLDLAYDVEDVLDSYTLKLEERSQRRGLRRLTNKVGEKMDAYNIVDDVRILKTRILDITRKRETYGIGSFNESRGESSTNLRVRQLRRTPPVDQEQQVVGMEDDAKILLVKLLGDNKEDKRHIISIFGMGGLGKTALARKLYNSVEVKRRFDCRAWTYVSQEYKTRDILVRIIRSLGVVSTKEIDEKINMLKEDEELEVYLYGLLEGKKYLVVVDDVWDPPAWESLKRALPCNHGGSRVIITTRIRAIAEGVDGTVYAHKLRFLTIKESWKLFEQKAFRNIEKVDEDLQRSGKEMVQKCGGLPLAIVVLSGILSRKRTNEWHEVCAGLWRRLNDNCIHISTVFDLSFKEMRHELKLCFLYLSIFPEDYEINVEKLIRLLVAEGFIQEDEEMMMEDVARYYIDELIDRSLLEAERIERGKVMTCKIHDLLRDVVIKKAKELNFVNVYNEKHHSSTMCRREVVHHLMNNNYLVDRRVNKRMRTFMFFGEGTGMVGSVRTSNLKLNLLRVLNMGGLLLCGKRYIRESLPEVIGELIHLRYLGIADNNVTILPAFVSNLRFLQTLDASRSSNDSDSFQCTTDLSELTSLRHVIGKFVGECLIGDAANLQTLRSISSYSWSKLKHELLINLRDLEIYDDSKWVDQRRVPLHTSHFSKLINLRVLKLEVGIFKLSSESESGLVDVIFPSLESLTLVGTNMEEDSMPALQKLPRLEDLVLKDCTYSGTKMSISAQGFSRLRNLKLFMVRLDELLIDEEALPSLIKLSVKKQGILPKLKIPDRLKMFVRRY
ncbi:PREDICTED: putative disease resistance RPP13-like protein 3 [Camelina sativa]|uniref:Disease resistance RPP13-like protein 3 n=1 Tax=Camelina sativa TaxID=90675 RepID=A0ABM0TGK1_CAMSA|nr:PREDICTED: putative disease resistance RPP13-like protein 3 [Camelina sativa]